MFASSVEIDINIKGKVSHVVFPEKGIDSIKVLRKLLDIIIFDSQEPLLFGCGKIYADDVRNILAENARSECTLRTLSIEKSKDVIRKFESAKSFIENDFKAKIDLIYNSFYTEELNLLNYF